MVRPGAPVLSADTIAEMLALRPEADGTYILVAGFRGPDDNGGGVFQYQRLSAEAANGGTVLQVDELPGRFRRLFDPRGDVCAEWFGAYGDGDSAEPHDDQAAINACLVSLGRVKLLSKTYGVKGKPTHYNPEATYNAVDLGPDYRIEGSGREETTIKLLDGSNPKGSSPGNNYFNLMGNREFQVSADRAVIRDLTIDCNFDGQNKQTTINAIGVRGGSVLVERVNFRGYGTGWHPEGSSREAFVIHQSLVYKASGSSRQAATYRDLDFTDPGHNGSVAGHVGEITHITLGGAHNFGNYSWIMPGGADPDFDPANDGENVNNWWPSYGGLVERCTVHDETYDPETQKSPLHGITYADCVGLTIRNNRFTNFEGPAVFVMSWWNRDTTIVDNVFDGVSTGLALHIKGHDDKPVQCPSHENVLFERNRISLCKPVHHQWPPRGVHLYGQSLGEGIRLSNIVVRNNTIEGRSYTDALGKAMYPTGIGVQILHANYAGLLFEDNEIDVPDYPQSDYVPQKADSMAMTFFPLARWEDDARSGRVVYRGNRTPKGRELFPILADWYFKNKPTWGKPEGCVPDEG